MQNPSDRLLIQGLARGEEQAFAALYDRLGPALFRVARALLGGRQDAEDVVQEVFVGLLRSRRSLAGVQNLRAYAFAALRSAAGRIAAARKKERRTAADLCDLPQSQERSLNAERPAPLERALRSLPAEQLDLIALKTEGELPSAEAPACLGISPNTAASRYRYALEKLRAALEE